MDKRGTQTDGPKNKVIFDDAYDLQSRDDIDRLYVTRKKKEEEDLPVLGIA